VLIATMTTNDDFLRDCVMAILRNITLHPENKVVNCLRACICMRNAYQYPLKGIFICAVRTERVRYMWL
jgi:hypothetical protein